MSSIFLGEILSGLLFVGVIGALLLGFPVAFTLAGTSLISVPLAIFSAFSIFRTLATSWAGTSAT